MALQIMAVNFVNFFFINGPRKHGWETIDTIIKEKSLPEKMMRG